MKRIDITRTIASLLITAAMLGVTGCGNVNTDTSSAAPKATTTAAETTETGTMTSRSATTTSHSSISVSSSSSVTSSAQGSSGSSSAPKNTMMTTKSNNPVSNGVTANNNQSYSHSTANNGSGNNSYSNDNNNSYQPQQTERQTERLTVLQTTTTAKKTQAPKPKPTTTSKPKFKLTQNDIDRVVKELQQYSNETCDFDAIFYTEQEMWDNIATRNLDNSSWGTPYTVLPDTYSSCDELYGVVKGGIKDLYGRIGNDQAHIVVYQQWHGDGSAINSGGKPAWEIYLLY